MAAFFIAVAGVAVGMSVGTRPGFLLGFGSSGVAIRPGNSAAATATAAVSATFASAAAPPTPAPARGSIGCDKSTRLFRVARLSFSPFILTGSFIIIIIIIIIIIKVIVVVVLLVIIIVIVDTNGDLSDSTTRVSRSCLCLYLRPCFFLALCITGKVIY